MIDGEAVAHRPEGLEGIVSKPAMGRYVSGLCRSRVKVLNPAYAGASRSPLPRRAALGLEARLREGFEVRSGRRGDLSAVQDTYPQYLPTQVPQR
jgi:hypothetical protein